MRKLIFIFSAFIFGAVVVASCTSKDRRSTAPSTTSSSITQSSDGAPRITVSDLKAKMDAGTVVVIDVRGQAAYDAGHIKGSIMIPAAEIGNRVNELPRDKEIVTYCS